MNKTIRNVLAGAAVLFATTGCVSKCSYEEFLEDYNAGLKAAAEKVITKTKINGKVKDSEFKVEFEKEDDLSVAERLTFEFVKSTLKAVSALCTVKNDKATYYSGNGFKIETEGATYKLDKYCNVTLMDSEELDLKISYTYSNK